MQAYHEPPTCHTNMTSDEHLNSNRSSKDWLLLAARIVMVFSSCSGRMTMKAVKWRARSSPGPKLWHTGLELPIHDRCCALLDSKST